MSFFSVTEFKRAESLKHQQRLKDAAKARMKEVVSKKKKYPKEARIIHNDNRLLEMGY